MGRTLAGRAGTGDARSLATDHVYVMEFDGGKIRHMTKIWNDTPALRLSAGPSGRQVGFLGAAAEPAGMAGAAPVTQRETPRRSGAKAEDAYLWTFVGGGNEAKVVDRIGNDCDVRHTMGKKISGGGRPRWHEKEMPRRSGASCGDADNVRENE